MPPNWFPLSESSLKLNPALPHVFEIGKEVDCFSDRDSLLERVRYYLSHEEEREEIAARAYARALRDYEDGPYIDQVIRELNAIFPARPRGRRFSPKARNYKRGKSAILSFT